MTGGRLLTAVVTGAGPAAEVLILIDQAQSVGWRVNVVATPNALPFINVGELEALSGSEVRSQPRSPSLPRNAGGAPDAIIVAPATFNTINKLAAGCCDTYALTALAEAIGVGTPVVLVPFVNASLASRVPYGRSLSQLAEEGVRIIEGEADGWLPHPLGSGGEQQKQFPWRLAMDEAIRLSAATEQ